MCPKCPASHCGASRASTLLRKVFWKGKSNFEPSFYFIVITASCQDTDLFSSTLSESSHCHMTLVGNNSVQKLRDCTSGARMSSRNLGIKLFTNTLSIRKPKKIACKWAIRWITWKKWTCARSSSNGSNLLWTNLSALDARVNDNFLSIETFLIGATATTHTRGLIYTWNTTIFWEGKDS